MTLEPLFKQEDLERMERELYSDEEWAELQELRRANPGAICVILRPNIYEQLGVPELDPAYDLIQEQKRQREARAHGL